MIGITSIILALLVWSTLCFDGIRVSTASTQDDLDYISTNIDVKLYPVDNTVRDLDGYVPILLQLRNTGDKHVRFGSWKIYFNIMYGLKIGNSNCSIHVGHMNGLLYYLKPFRNFIINPSDSISCILLMLHHGNKRSDFMPNWYTASPGLFPKIIQSTALEGVPYVGPFDSANKWKISDRDQYRPLSAEDRFRINERKLITSNNMDIIPSPLDVSQEDGFVHLTSAWHIRMSRKFPNSCRILSKKLNLSFSSGDKRVFVFDFRSPGNFYASPEAYRIEVDRVKEMIKIITSSEIGAFYGVQTLVQIIDSNEKGEKVIPVVTITDRPRFQHRGLMLDIARNFHDGETIIPLISIMSKYKLNKLHLHATDDEGWRLEIPSLPELTGIGSNRCHASIEGGPCLIPSHGSGPYNNTSGSGYLSVKEFRKILKHAEDNYVSLILEIDMPGHSRAAWRSMKSQQEDPNNKTYRSVKVDDLDEVDGTTDEVSQRWRRSSLNPCLESTYIFVEMVIRDIVAMYDGIQDLKHLHIGGDEVVFAEWAKSFACQKYFSNVTIAKLSEFFVEKVSNILLDYDIDPIIWADGLYDRNALLNLDLAKGRKATVQTWFNAWDLGYGARSVQLANNGYDVIMSQATHLYLCHAQEPDPEEWGLYWTTRYSDTFNVFSFNARDIYKTRISNTYGELLNMTSICLQFPCPKLEKSLNIKGIEACLWSETIRNQRRLFYMLFPRLLAVAERAWHEAYWERYDDETSRDMAINTDWEIFRKKLAFRHLEELPFYRVPPPGAIFKNGKLHVNVFYDNHVVEISKDCNSNWTVVENSIDTLHSCDVICLRSKPINKMIYSRIIRMTVDFNEASVAMRTGYSELIHLQSHVMSLLAFHYLFHRIY